MKSNTKSIGKPSGNGFVNEIVYAHRGYNAYAILKSNIGSASDNSHICSIGCSSKIIKVVNIILLNHYQILYEN